jgi:hypothetical protein
MKNFVSGFFCAPVASREAMANARLSPGVMKVSREIWRITFSLLLL